MSYDSDSVLTAPINMNTTYTCFKQNITVQLSIQTLHYNDAII